MSAPYSKGCVDLASATYVDVLEVHTGAGLQQDVDRIHVPCQHGTVQRRVPVHLIHSIHRGVTLQKEVCGLRPAIGRKMQEQGKK